MALLVDTVTELRGMADRCCDRIEAAVVPQIDTTTELRQWWLSSSPRPRLSSLLPLSLVFLAIPTPFLFSQLSDSGIASLTISVPR